MGGLAVALNDLWKAFRRRQATLGKRYSLCSGVCRTRDERAAPCASMFGDCTLRSLLF
jgi:hypothetical protein